MIIQVTRAGVILSVVKNGPRITVQHVGLQGANGVGVPTGGTTGQVLSKASNSDYDTEWVNPSGGGGGVSDHGALTGLADDDHSQYHNDTRGDARYYTKSQSDTNYEAKNSNIQTHIASTSNPHGVTKSQVGLSNVANADTTTTANITDSTNKRFVTDAEKTVIGNTSGTNTGDQDLSGKLDVGLAVLKSDYTPAHSILVQQSGTGSPSALQVGNNTLVGRLSGGGSNVDDLSTSQVRTLLSIDNVDNTSDANKPVSTAQQTAINLKVDKAGDTMSGALTITGNNGVEFAGVKVNNTSLTGFSAINARADDGEVIQINALNSGGAAYGAQQPGEFALYAKRNLNIVVDDAVGEHRICGAGAVLRARFKATGVLEVPAIDSKGDLVNSGPGTDGAGNINSNVALSRSTAYTNLTVTSIGVLRPQGFFIYSNGRITINGGGGITQDGAAGGNGAATTTGGTAGPATQSNELFGSLIAGVGGAGATGAGVQAAAVAAAVCLVSTAAGNGGAGGTGTGGAGGASRAGSTASFRPHFGITSTPFLTGIAAKYGGQSAPGGSGGGGDGTAGGGGGGGGAGGGTIFIVCDELDNQGTIAARGGAGGNGGTPAAGNRGGGGGGGGGTGGYVYILCRRIINLGSILVTGGAGGTGGAGSGTGTAGSNGTAGGSGKYTVYESSTNTWTIV